MVNIKESVLMYTFDKSGKINSNKISKEYLLFYIIYMVIVTISGFTAYASKLHLVYNTVIILSILINLVFLVIFRSGNGYKNDWDYALIILIIIAVALHLVANIQIITYPSMAIYLFIANLKYVNLKEFITYDFKAKLILVGLIIFLYVINLTPYERISYRNGLPRLGLGFGNYNGCAEIILCLLLSCMLFLGKNAYKIKNIFILSIISLIVIRLTGSRGFMYSMYIIIALLLLGKIKIIRKIIKFLLFPILVFSAFVAIYIPEHVYIGSANFNYFNKMFSNRLIYQNMIVLNHHIKWIGNFSNKLLQYYNNNNIYIDNGYLMLLLLCGIIGFIIFGYFIVKSCYISIRYKSYLLCLIFIAISLYMIIESPFNNINLYVPIMYSFILNNHIEYKRKLMK